MSTPTFTAVLRVAEFRAMWLAEVLSVAGDQIARVALSVLVFDRTDSAALTALTYALTFLPALVGGVMLSGLGDRHPRRTVMIASDIGRAVLVGLMIVPGMPLWALCALVAAVTLLNGPFKAAQQALLPDVLTNGKFRVGMALRNISSQAAQLAGFAGGGLMVAHWGPFVALAVNAGTFVASAALLLLLRRRPAVTPSSKEGQQSYLSSIAAGAALVFRVPALRTLLALNWLAGFYVVAEGLAAPYADEIGAGPAAVGLLMAADPLGSVIGAAIFGRWVSEETNVRALGLLGIAAGIPLILLALKPALIVALALLALSGALATGYHFQTVVQFTERLPDERRAQGTGLASSGVITVQGLGALAAGGLADLIGAANAIGVAAVAGVLVAIPIAISWARVRHTPPVRSAAA
ncbi:MULTISPECIES: MFS transporter [Thermocrispum]|uniref:MFS transporter n=1 Tax=Thermocrispum TaxID=37924 RepID=UPI00041A2041|nr:MULTISPECIES: MFS transporter [Thermocrispum]